MMLASSAHVEGESYGDMLEGIIEIESNYLNEHTSRGILVWLVPHDMVGRRYNPGFQSSFVVKNE